jgi:hypothetical protein
MNHSFRSKTVEEMKNGKKDADLQAPLKEMIADGSGLSWTKANTHISISLPDILLNCKSTRHKNFRKNKSA